MARTALEALIQELELEADVDLPRQVPHPSADVARSTVFALSSAWEGLGNVLVAAMAPGIPVVSTRCESGPAETVAGRAAGCARVAETV